MKEIDEFKQYLAAKTPGDLIFLFSVLFCVIGLTGGFLLGQYQASAKITQDLEDHALVDAEPLEPAKFFSIDGEYIYYLVKTNITLGQYESSILKGDGT